MFRALFVALVAGLAVSTVVAGAETLEEVKADAQAMMAKQRAALQRGQAARMAFKPELEQAQAAPATHERRLDHITSGQDSISVIFHQDTGDCSDASWGSVFPVEMCVAMDNSSLWIECDDDQIWINVFSDDSCSGSMSSIQYQTDWCANYEYDDDIFGGEVNVTSRSLHCGFPSEFDSAVGYWCNGDDTGSIYNGGQASLLPLQVCRAKGTSSFEYFIADVDDGATALQLGYWWDSDDCSNDDGQDESADLSYIVSEVWTCNNDSMYYDTAYAEDAAARTGFSLTTLSLAAVVLVGLQLTLFGGL